jgi:hypothetical protein
MMKDGREKDEETVLTLIVSEQDLSRLHETVTSSETMTHIGRRADPGVESGDQCHLEPTGG